MDPSMDDPMSEEEEEVEDDDDGLDLPAGSDEGVVMEGVEIAEEDIYAYGDPDDPLDRVLDVYLADELEDHLYLLQYPMRPADRPSSTPLAVKVKVGNHLLEVEHAIKQGGKHFDKNAPPQLRQATQKHTGSRVRPATNFAFGVVRNNEFHLTPVHATMQMRPCFQHIDDAKALEIEMDLDDPENGGAKAEERPQQVSFKKKESERATAARKSTYAYKKSIEDAEPWVALEVHGQNDQRSLDEFARMFSDHDNASGGGSTAKDFPAPERYLKGLDYMEEYDENGESFSVGGGRSLDDSIDLVAPGASTYSPVKIPSAPLQQLGGEAKIVGYLKLAHLVPFSVLLDVTKSSPDAVIRALSVEGRQRGLLVRGNWAAHAADVWPKGPPHAADCLSVAQLLIHRYGAVSRPDLQRRFPELGPVVLKEVLANIAELDTVGRRWVAKLKDGVSFGMEYCDIVELEEERWMIQASSLKERLGEDILAPPSCQTFEPFAEVLVSAATARVEFPSPVLSSVPALPMPSHRSSAAAAAAPPAFGQVAVQNGAGSAEGGDDEFDQLMLAEHLRPSEEFKEISKAGAGSGASSAGPTFAPKRHFKPKKRVPKPAGGGGAVKETRVKLEHEEAEAENGDGGVSGHSAGVGSSEGGVPEAGTEDQEAATEAEVVGGNGGLAVEEEVPPVGKGVGRRSRRNAPAVAESDEVTGGDDAAALSEGENEGAAATAGLGASGSVTGVSSVGRGGERPAAMPLMAKEEPREKCAEPMEGVGAGEGGVVDATGEGGAGSAGAEKGAGAGAKKGKGKVKAKEEPAPRPRIRPRTRPKPKAK